MAGFVPEFSSKDVNRRLDFRKLSNKISKMATSAASFSIDESGLKPNRKNADDFGVAVAISNGPPEIMHMDKVFSSGTYAADTTTFSNITANSVAGWIANILYLKGINTTLGNGPHSGLQAIAFAFDNMKLGKSKYMVAGAADEIDKQTFYNYDLLGHLYTGEKEKEYKYRPDETKKRFLVKVLPCF